MTDAQRDIKRKMKVLEYAKECGNVAKTCRYFGISRQCYYNWLHAYERRGEAGLIDSRPGRGGGADRGQRLQVGSVFLSALPVQTTSS